MLAHPHQELLCIGGGRPCLLAEEFDADSEIHHNLTRCFCAGVGNVGRSNRHNLITTRPPTGVQCGLGQVHGLVLKHRLHTLCYVLKRTIYLHVIKVHTCVQKVNVRSSCPGQLLSFLALCIVSSSGGQTQTTKLVNRWKGCKINLPCLALHVFVY